MFYPLTTTNYIIRKDFSCKLVSNKLCVHDFTFSIINLVIFNQIYYDPAEEFQFAPSLSSTQTPVEHLPTIHF